jgi:hypothetical protein
LIFHIMYKYVPILICLLICGLKPELNFNHSPDIFDHQFCRSQRHTYIFNFADPLKPITLKIIKLSPKYS